MANNRTNMALVAKCPLLSAETSLLVTTPCLQQCPSLSKGKENFGTDAHGFKMPPHKVRSCVTKPALKAKV